MYIGLFRRHAVVLAAILGAWALAPGAGPRVAAQSTGTSDPAVFKELHWRNIGPHRASRTKALDGVPGQPHTFYIGVVQRRRVEDHRRRPHLEANLRRSADRFHWRALRSRLPIPNVIYVGTGEGQQRPDLATGDGMYKSTDGGRTWTHLGLRDTQQIAQIVVDPNDPDRLFVAALGHPYGPNTERGIFRSTDGGKTFERCSTRTRTPAASTSCSIRRIRTSSTPRCGGAAGAVGERRLLAARAAASSSRPTAARRGAADGPADVGAAMAGPHRHRHRAEPAVAAVCRGRGAHRRRHLPLRRCRRELDARQQRRARVGAARRCADIASHPTNPDIVYRRRRRHLEVHRRRQDLHRRSAARLAATTTSATGSTRPTPTSSR